jgi:hypothetical protein
MTSFLTFLAIPAIKQATEKSTFEKPFVRMGRLYGVVGVWVYQQGGLLGYILREHPHLLVKLIAPPDPSFVPEQALIELYDTRKIISKELENLEKDENTFFSLYTVRELRQTGIELIKFPADKGLDKKVDFESASQIMRLAFIKGVAFGFHCPELFVSCWDATYKVVPDKEWEEYWKRGIVPEMQRTIPFDQAVCDLCEGAIAWSIAESSEVLDTSDIRLLHSIISTHKGKSR